MHEGDRVKIRIGMHSGMTGEIYLITDFWYFVRLEDQLKYPNVVYKNNGANTSEIELVETEEEGAIKLLGEDYFA